MNIRVSSPSISMLLQSRIDPQWKNCTRCPLGTAAFCHVLYEVTYKHDKHVDVLMIGEAPGASENVLDKPFIGEAGSVLRDAIRQAGPGSLNWALTNTLACRPPDNRDPTEEEMEACSPRLRDTINLMNPKAVVLLGRVAETWYETYGESLDPSPGRLVKQLYHPSYIYRKYGRDYHGRPAYCSLVEGLTQTFREVKGLK